MSLIVLFWFLALVLTILNAIGKCPPWAAVFVLVVIGLIQNYGR